MNRLFISYSHKDKTWKDRLVTQLKIFEKEEILSIWDDRRIEIGNEWYREIEKAVQEANAVILLISPDFLNSDFIINIEIPLLLERIEKEGLKIVPLLVRPCAWKMVPWLATMQVTPKDGKPLASKSAFEIKKELASLARKLFSEIAMKGKSSSSRYSETQVSLAKLPVSGKDLFGREKELDILDKAWADPHTHVVTFVAWGGVGKTALVNHWLNLMEKQDYRGAKRVFGWSFYSQGAEAGKQASADDFMQTALAWFGDPDSSVGGAVEKNRRLVELLRRIPTLLVLDGLEPLQYPPGELHGFDGRLKDPGLKVLLKELAVTQPGLCVITTRESLADLADKVGHSVQEVGLEHLAVEAGAQLLRSLGVIGAEKELVQAVQEYDGHALALTLLGHYLHSVFQGDIRRRDQIPGLTLERQKGGQARRMMAAYEGWWGEALEVKILRLLGLFDRPVEPGAIAALTAAPPLPGITSQLQDLSAEGWQWALSNLRDAGLLAKADPHKPGELDCHPLIREYFAAKLREEHPKELKEAHTRLYRYYKSVPGKEFPDTLREMEPLFAALTHGCAAGLHREVLTDIFWKRIRRGNEGYTVHKLGAFGSDLAALSHFFEVPWSQPAAGLKDSDKALILGWAAFGLRAGGRLREAIQPMQAGLESLSKQENWKQSAIAAGNLSELELTLGQVNQAVAYARQSVTYADRSGDWGEKMIRRTTLADALHQSGQGAEAEQLFREAETLQKKIQPEFTFLYSVQGFRFCDLLLAHGKYREVLERAKQTLTWVTKQNWLLDLALDTLSQGRALMMQAVNGKTGEFSKAGEYLHQAVEGLREAGTQEFLSKGLLASAEVYRRQMDYAKAWQDLREAFEIAQLGGMKLYLADYHLEAGKLCAAQGQKEQAEDHFRTAKEMIDEMGYHRRDVEFQR